MTIASARSRAAFVVALKIAMATVERPNSSKSSTKKRETVEASGGAVTVYIKAGSGHEQTGI